VTDLRLGGTQTILLERVRRPGPFRHEVLVFAPHTGIPAASAGPPPPDLAEAFAEAGVAVHSLDLFTPRQAVLAWITRRLAGRLRRLPSSGRPSLVHSTLFHTHLLGEHLRRRWRIPHVASKEGLDLWMRPWHRAAESAALRRAARVVAVSGAVAETARALGVRDERLRKIPNGIDPARPGTWSTPPAADDPRDRRLVAVGRCHPAKGWEDLLAAMVLVRRRVPDTRLDLIVSGRGADRARLAATARRLGVADAVHMERTDDPARPSPEPDAPVEQRPILVVPSREEGFGLVLLEGMARGLPIVATRVGGIPEVARDGREALLVPPRDPAALAHAILTLLADADLAADLVRAGTERVREFTAEEMVRRYHDLYGEMLLA
jgi:glycosyltransferase involved in cell wall biosynthesis